jgi:hypothetical protein
LCCCCCCCCCCDVLLLLLLLCVPMARVNKQFCFKAESQHAILSTDFIYFECWSGKIPHLNVQRRDWCIEKKTVTP